MQRKCDVEKKIDTNNEDLCLLVSRLSSKLIKNVSIDDKRMKIRFFFDNYMELEIIFGNNIKLNSNVIADIESLKMRTIKSIKVPSFTFEQSFRKQDILMIEFEEIDQITGENAVFIFSRSVFDCGVATVKLICDTNINEENDETKNQKIKLFVSKLLAKFITYVSTEFINESLKVYLSFNKDAALDIVFCNCGNLEEKDVYNNMMSLHLKVINSIEISSCKKINDEQIYPIVYNSILKKLDIKDTFSIISLRLICNSVLIWR